MPYASLDDLIERAGLAEIRQVADRDRDGDPDPAVIAAALTHADNIVNGYVEARYAPLATIPDLVRTWAVSIARYHLHRNGPPEYVKTDYDQAIAALKDVARGLIALPVAPPDASPTAITGEVMAAHPPEVFTPDRLRGWR